MKKDSGIGLFLIAGFLFWVLINLTDCLLAPSPVEIPALTNTSNTGLTDVFVSSFGLLPAFPGAEGFGAMAAGGREGRVIEVTNLNDAGEASLRAAIEAKGPRFIVFRVAGVIELESDLVIMEPYLTIAGQTAPGGGITLRGVNSQITALINIQTHDVVIRFLTLRAGPPSAGDAMEIFASDRHDTYNIVVDHNSLSWAVNRNLATWYDVHDLSIQWNIFSEGLNCSIHPKGCHSKGVLIGGYASDENKDKPGAYNISFHHNLMAHNGERNPYIEASGVVDVVNNVAYNPFGTFSHIDMIYQLTPSLTNYIGNIYKPGPNTEVKYGIRVLNSGAAGTGIFVQNNIGPNRESDSLPENSIVDPASRQFVMSTPFPADMITTTTALQAYEQVLSGAGANIGLNCDGTLFLRRDDIDTRIVKNVRDGTGGIIDDPSEVGGWLAVLSDIPCLDSDHDGMPDEWEQIYGFDPIHPADGSQDADGDGYTNIEEFLNNTRPLH
ncbi:MAG: pectate lyase [Anaerolineales bacterium]|nr:pectate lyase [Anaerolineales bacterium]